MLGGWLNPEAPALFARYCGVVAERFGDRISSAVTMNEPNLARLLGWLHLPDFVRDLEQQTLAGASTAAGVPRYRLSNVMLAEEMDDMADAMEAGHRAAKAAIKAACSALPVGLSIAIVDDQVVGDDAGLRDRKREEVYGRWLRLAREDDFVGIQNYERVWYDARGEVPPEDGRPLNSMGTGIYPESLSFRLRSQACEMRWTMVCRCSATPTGHSSTTGGGSGGTPTHWAFARWTGRLSSGL